MMHLGPLLVAAGLLGLVASRWLATPPWVWLAVVGGGLAHSLMWRAAGVRRVSARERSRNAVRLRNADRRERRLSRTALRTERRVKEVLERCVDMEWARGMTEAVKTLQTDRDRHEQVLLQYKMLQEKTARDLGEVFNKVENE
jgi:hypothetical protein